MQELSVALHQVPCIRGLKRTNDDVLCIAGGTRRVEDLRRAFAEGDRDDERSAGSATTTGDRVHATTQSVATRQSTEVRAAITHMIRAIVQSGKSEFLGRDETAST